MTDSTPTQRPVTRSQQLAQKAYACVAERKKQMKGKPSQAKEYLSFARQFPTLVHSCGLAQALAFADAKEHHDLLDDLAAVSDTPRANLLATSRTAPVRDYLRLSRQTLDAATWLKTFAESLLETADRAPGKDGQTSDDQTPAREAASSPKPLTENQT